jgi:hypothetical protein
MEMADAMSLHSVMVVHETLLFDLPVGAAAAGCLAPGGSRRRKDHAELARPPLGPEVPRARGQISLSAFPQQEARLRNPFALLHCMVTVLFARQTHDAINASCSLD